MKKTLSALLLVGLPLLAQQVNNTEKTLDCDGGRNWNNGRQQRFCEVRENTAAPTPRLQIDGRTNGGIQVKGWNRNEVLVRSRVEVWAPTEAEARSLAGQVSVTTAGGAIQASAPDFGRDRGWSVTYEVFVPHRTDLTLKTHNGGLRVADVTGDIGFDAQNGGVSLARLAGTVKGQTTNGGLKIELAGTRWEGTELNVTATNGGVSIEVPENYSARLEAGTVNGRISVDFPVTVQGNIRRQLSIELGGGGPLIRAYTTNGGVSVRRKKA